MINLEQHRDAATILKNILYMNVATVCPDGTPWNTPVYWSYSPDFHLYWMSWKENQHSLNISDNGQVFVTVYDSSVPFGDGYGVYLQGTARVLTSPTQIAQAFVSHYGRTNRRKRAVKLFLTTYPRRVYEFVPIRAWVNENGTYQRHFVDVREELDLPTLRQCLAERTLEQ